MIYTPMTSKAFRVAYAAHHGQVDKAGVPYIHHPLHVAEQMDDDFLFGISEKTAPQNRVCGALSTEHDRDYLRKKRALRTAHSPSEGISAGRWRVIRLLEVAVTG